MQRRELAGWVALATLGLMLVTVCLVVAWAAVPRERGLAVGSLSAFPTDEPQAVQLSIGTVYLVDLQGTPVAWDTRAPVSGTRCTIKWVPVNHRFEDPCSGNKWCLDGTVADDRYGPVTTLNSYALEIDAEGTVWLNPSRPVAGTPMPAPPPTGSTFAYNCDHLQD